MDIKKPTKAELTAWLKDNGFDHDTHVYVPASKVADMPDLPATSIGDLLKEYLNKVETPDDYNLIPASKVSDRPAPGFGDPHLMLKEYMNKVESPADYVFDPKTPIKPRREPTVHNIDLTKKTPEDYWRKLALDFRADRDRLQKQVDESGASYRRTIDRVQTNINEKTDLIARLRGCLDKERDAYAKLHKEVEECVKAIKENNAMHYETHKELMLARQEAREKQATIDRLRAEWNRTIDLALAYEDKLQQINKEWPGILGGEELRALMMTNSNKA